MGFNYRVGMQIFVTLSGLIGGGYIILSGNFSEGAVSIAGGAIGTVVGYWMK
jgi:hypothetical protein